MYTIITNTTIFSVFNFISCSLIFTFGSIPNQPFFTKVFMKKVELEIIALSHSLAQSHNYAIVLGEMGGARRLPIVIGEFEAQAIAVAMEGMSPSRPMTHDLFKNTLTSFNIEIKEIVINNLIDGIFYANLVCIQNNEQTLIDSRTSDAIALGVRFNVPLYTYDFILEQAGIILDEESGDIKPGSEVKKVPVKQRSLDDLTTDELNEKLNDALEKEDYEKAAMIRDLLNSRGSN